MCGILAIYSEKMDILNLRELEKVSNLFSYRGPDDSGIEVFAEHSVALVHRRLSILDPTPAGKQPMWDLKKENVIVYNGEVYNYLEIKKTLEEKGYSFNTGTDTEIILSAYDAWGEECISKFNGMFAFAIYNTKKRQLFIARDRLGIKPIYYYKKNGVFIIASEVKAIIAVLGSKPSINVPLIDTYMSFGYVPGEETLFKDIKKLLPGHFILSGKKKFEINKYWDLSFNNSMDRGKAYYIENLESLLNSSIDFRLRSDVPLGIFLSGGIDSSAVVALLAPRVDKPLKTFSVAYDFGREYNETSYARIVSEHFKTDHHEFFISAKDFRDFIPSFVYHMDEPVTEAAAISLYYISKLAKDYVTVVLSGEGSDELFAGYDFYFYNRIIESYRRILGHKMSAGIGSLLKSVPLSSKLNKYLSMSQLQLEMRYKGTSTYEEGIKNDLYKNDFRESLREKSNEQTNELLIHYFDKTTHSDILSRMLYFDTKTWLVDDLLIKADKMTMAASLELRVPFLDHRIVEFAASMPSKYKLKGKVTKYVLKKMLKGKLPDKIINRKKMGFPTPLKIMFQGELFEYAKDILLSKNALERGYFNKSNINKILNKHKKGEEDNHRLIWQLIVLEEWHRRFID